MPRSTISDGDGSEADRGSVCSTIASTTSVTDKIQDLTQNFRDKFRRVHQEPPLYEGIEADDDEEEVIEISEEQLMQELDSMEPPLQVGFQLSCCCSPASKDARRNSSVAGRIGTCLHPARDCAGLFQAVQGSSRCRSPQALDNLSH